MAFSLVGWGVSPDRVYALLPAEPFPGLACAFRLCGEREIRRLSRHSSAAYSAKSTKM